MQDVARQLEGVRRRGRWLLVWRVLGQALTVVLPVAIGLGLVDFVLRMPGWLRAAIVLTLLSTGGWWLFKKLRKAWAFAPTISELAIRVERIYPRLAGLLSSALEFALYPQRYAQPVATAAMAQASVSAAQQQLAGVSVGRLIDLRPTRKIAAWLLVTMALTAVVVTALPTYSMIAVSRWLAPFGDTAWPKRTEIAATVTDAVHPVDTPVEFTAHVGRGYKPGMRVWLQYQWVDESQPDAAGPVESMLMTEQLSLSSDDGTAASREFKLQWRPPAEMVRQITAGQQTQQTLRYWFAAGDDATKPTDTVLVARPTLETLTAEVEPPAYAAGLVAPQTVRLDEQGQRIAALPALIGSRVRLTLKLNKPLPEASLRPEVLAPGLASSGTLEVIESSSTTVQLSFVLDETRQTALSLTDEHGLTNPAERVYRFEGLVDRPANVTILEPSADASVLPTAVIPVSARATDDVGVNHLALDAQHPARGESISPDTVRTTPLTEKADRLAELAAEVTLDLASLDVQPGDVVTLNATARDVYDLLGAKHDPVKATPRRLRIIDPATLISQIRGDLAGVRQQAVRLERQQTEINRRADQDPGALRSEQSRVGRTLETQSALLKQLQQRMQRNRLEEPTLDELLRQAAELIDEAQEASDAAEQSLEEAEQARQQEAQEKAQQLQQQANQSQQQARNKLDALAKLLDQGGDALGLKLELTRLQTEQDRIAQDTRELLPRTVGRSAENLPDDLKQALKDLAERQRNLAEQAGDAVQKLQSTAESLAKQGESDADRAAAQALAEAAATAQRQGLNQQMQQAQQGVENNQLSQAGQSQQQSLDTLQSMLNQMGEQDELRQELLRRRLMAIGQKLRQLIEDQQAVNVALPDAADLPGLAEQRQSPIWVRTVSLQTDMEADEQTTEVAPVVGRAAEAQAAALVALRAKRADDASVSTASALDRLEEALAQIEKKREEAEQDKTQQERDELRQKYVELAQQQAALTAEVAELTAETPLSRRARASLRGLGTKQGELRTAAAELGEKVAETLVFKRTHSLIDRSAERATQTLTGGSTDARVAMDQSQVQVLLESMADALAQAGGKSEFAQDSQQGGGGSGGGAGQTPPLVPPVAELKLLRGVQQSVYDQTRSLDDQIAGQPTPLQGEVISELGQQQRELSDLGQRLIEQMNQNQPHP